MKRLPKFHLNDKSTLIPFGFASILLFIIFFLVFLSREQGKTPVVQPQNTPLPRQISPVISPFDPYADTVVERIIPSVPLPLTPGLPYSFTIYFKDTIAASDVKFTLTSSPIYEDKQPSTVKIAAIQTDPKVFVVKTTEPINELSEYILTIFNAKTNKEAFKKGYMTKDVVGASVEVNNPELLKYIPYETNTYILEYLPERNVYVFHFKYNTDLPGSAEEQFNSAQAEAKKYIQSKGIKLDSIVIEWRNS